MNTLTNESVTKMYTVNCSCGGVYAISATFRQEKQEKGGGWTCPYCRCSWGYFGKTELDRAREKAERLERDAQQLREQRDAAHRQASAQRGVTTRIKNRVANGVCPCCKRSFVELARHMATKHPEYAPEGR